MKNIKAVIFDMDGVLVDIEPLIVQNEKRMFRKLGLDISDEEHSSYMGIASEILNPECIVIGSIYSRNEKLFKPHIERILAEEAIPSAVEVCQIKLHCWAIPSAILPPSAWH